MRRSRESSGSQSRRPRFASTGRARSCESSSSRCGESQDTRSPTNMQCEAVADLLANAADGSVMLDRTTRRHVDRCLRCQAELVQYRKLLRALHNLRTEVLVPAPGLLSDILATIEEAGRDR